MTEGRRELIETLFRSVSTVLMDVARGTEERLLVLSNPGGTNQLYELDGSELHQLTSLDDPVTRAAYIPGQRQAVLSSDVGGDERNQLYLLSLEPGERGRGRLEPLTADPRYGHELAGVSPDGRLLAYTSNSGNGVDYDLWTVELTTRAHRLLWAGGGYCFGAGGFSPDGRWIAVNRTSTRRPLDGDLFLIDVATGEAREPLAHPDEAVCFGMVDWVSADRFSVSSNAGRDFSAILRHDLESCETVAVAGTGIDADAIQMLGDAVLLENRDFATPLWRWSAEQTPGAQIDWPEPGVCTNWATPAPQLSSDGRRLYFSHMSLRSATAVYRNDLDSGATTRLTQDPFGVDPAVLAVPEVHTITSFDGEPIQLYVMSPARTAAAGRPPVVVLLHGGPAMQSQFRFDPVKQALVAAGYAVVVPNVRGSTGYGRRFAALDDVQRRLDAVADLAAIHGVLGQFGLDDTRAALWGESYGGYMVLSGLSMQPELWVAGVDIVGIANVVTYLENTAPYRRAMREVEYGSLERDRELLAAISPMTHVDQIRAPLFVVHGANDPRVPVSESVALHAALVARAVHCELTIYENEGHGIARLENRLDAYPRAIAFLDSVLERHQPTVEPA